PTSPVDEPPNQTHHEPLCGPVPPPVPQLAASHRTVPYVAEDSSQNPPALASSNPPSWITSAIGATRRSRTYGARGAVARGDRRSATPPACAGAASSIVHVRSAVPVLPIVSVCLAVVSGGCEAVRLDGVTSITGAPGKITSYVPSSVAVAMSDESSAGKYRLPLDGAVNSAAYSAGVLVHVAVPS